MGEAAAGEVAGAARVDLHLHSDASDGTLPPAEVVATVDGARLEGFSLTDHDTVSGLREASEEASRRDLRLLVGAELSANEPGRSVHLLAFGFRVDDPGMTEFFQEFRVDRFRRAREIVARFREQGIALGWEAVARETGGGVPTRAHVARALVREGLVPDQRTVFTRYLGRGGPAFVEKRPMPPAEVFERVHAAGGVVVLAHPGWTHGPEEIERWVDEGLDGLEVRHPRNDPRVRRRLQELAREHDLLVTGGSDWHGPEEGRPGPGSEDVPFSWMEAVASRCEEPYARGAVEDGSGATDTARSGG